MNTSNSDIKQKPVFDYKEEDLIKFKYLIGKESENLLKLPHPVQSQLIALKVLNLDLDYNMQAVVKEMQEILLEFITLLAKTEDAEKRLAMAESSNSLIAVICFFNELNQLGLGFFNKISN